MQDTLHQRIDALEHENALLRTRLDALEQTSRLVRPTKHASHTTASTDDNTLIVRKDVPPGAIHLKDFAALHGLDRRKVLDHALRNNQEHIAIPIESRPGQYERYVTPEQQNVILAYWQRKTE